ncbi:MAG: ornithine cyclodeaminase family protein [Candidatus Hodarchaeota archaeon]
MEKMLYLSKSQIERLITFSETIQICEKAFRGFEEGTSLQDVNIMYFRPGHNPKKDPLTDCLLSQPCYSKRLKVAGIKMANYFLGNYEKGIDILQILVCMCDPDTGVPLAIMPGNVITQLRTSGNSTIAAKYLAKKDSSSIAIIGCGSQGRGHLMLMRELFDIRDVRIYDVRKEAMEKYRDEMGEKLKIDIRTFDSVKDAIKGADILCMVTTAAKPVVFEEWIEPGSFVSAVHAFSDLDIKFTKKADKFVIGERRSDVNYLSSRFEEFSEGDIDGTIGEIILGKKLGRIADDERTLFAHPGIVSLPDMMIASTAYHMAIKKGVGRELKL